LNFFHPENPISSRSRHGDAPQILAVLHQETSSCGRLGHMLEDMGYRLDIRRPPMGDSLPNTLENHAGAVIFGGPMSANDTHEYVKREIDWIKVPLSENKPFLGICLGAQMMAKYLGGSVQANEREFAEVGYYPLIPTEHGRDLFEWPGMVYQWHREGFTLPDGAVRLATGHEYENQAIRYGENAYGVQFHAELTFAMLYRWTTRGAHRFSLTGAQGRRQHIEGRYLYDAAVKRWLHGFLLHWIGPARMADQQENIVGADRA
jgi:GMP synthase (glutamine-hydrolysing)